MFCVISSLQQLIIAITACSSYLLIEVRPRAQCLHWLITSVDHNNFWPPLLSVQHLQSLAPGAKLEVRGTCNIIILWVKYSHILS